MDDITDRGQPKPLKLDEPNTFSVGNFQLRQ